MLRSLTTALLLVADTTAVPVLHNAPEFAMKSTYVVHVQPEFAAGGDINSLLTEAGHSHVSTHRHLQSDSVALTMQYHVK